jgi:hypothetical protein
MNLNTFRNFALDTVQENTEKIGIISAILILYYNPTLYLTIMGVSITFGLYHNFRYYLDIDFKMRKNPIENKTEYINLNESAQDEVYHTLNKSFMSDKIQTDTEIDPETDSESVLCKSTLFE